MISNQQHSNGVSAINRPFVALASNGNLDFIAFWRLISKYKWRILLLGLCTGLAAFLISMSIAPVYQATAVVLIESSKPQAITSIQDVYAGVTPTSEFFQTQAEILKSREVATSAIKKLKLWEHPGYDPRKVKAPIYRSVLNYFGISKTVVPEWDEDTLARTVYQSIAARNQINVDLIKGSQLVQVSFESTDRQVAADMANAIAEAFINSDRESRFAMTQQASAWVQDHIKGLRDTLDQSEARLQSYREKQGVISMDGSSGGGAAKMIEAVNQKLIDARLHLAEAQNTYEQIHGANPDALLSMPTIIQNPVIRDAHKQLQDAERNYSDLSQRYGPAHPKMIQAKDQLKIAKEQLAKSIDILVATAKHEFDVSQATERSLEQTLASAKGSVLVLNRKEIGLDALTREVATNRQLYDLFMSKSKENSATQDMQASVGRVVDPAQIPGNSIRPKTAMNVVLAAFLGLFLGVGITLLRAVLDNTLKNGADVENRLRQHLLAALPVLDKAARQNAGMVMQYEPHSQYAEGIRTIRTGVLLSALDQEKRVLLVTSSLQGEGKTTLASNLALAHAQTQKTLLIDADMRKPSVSSKLERDPTHLGLSDLIAGQATLSDVLQTMPETSLSLISAGTLPPNPLELLLSKRFLSLLAALKEQFEVIVIDSPPVELVSDALVLAPLCSSVIYVTRAQQTPIPLIKKCLARLSQSNCAVMGIVLNQALAKKQEDYEVLAKGKHGYGLYGMQGKLGKSKA
ncbi:MAG: polysaccharide biosynthesis tyrosine autokinase [Formivibrio sp.]|nr:polysaccharide biosynthesis tyrosine autokinase [Formivibrio sp.]